MRISKEYEVRKNELLDAAQKLFYQNGYDQTPVSTIIEAVGVSKGTFYYYFQSKKELLNNLVERMARQGSERIKPIVADKSLNAIEKFNRFFAITNAWKVANRELLVPLIEVLYKDENTLVRYMSTKRTIALAVPELAKIIKQGKQEGIFDCGQPNETAELILHLGNGLNDIVADLFLSLDQDPEAALTIGLKFDHFTAAVERILGVKSGSLAIIDKKFLKSILATDSKNQGENHD